MPPYDLSVSPKQTRMLLAKHWKSVFAVESFLILCQTLPILLWMLLVNTVTQEEMTVGCVVLLWGDLLLFSPLKAGRSLFYYGIAKQEKKVSFSRLFYFFKKGYRRAVRWRLRLWITRYSYWLVALLPCSALLFWNRHLQSCPVLSAISLLLAVVLGVFAIVFTEIRLLQYLAAVYLLPYSLPFKEVFTLSKTIFAKQLNRWVNFHLAYGYLILLPPVFHTARAATVNTMMQEFAKQPLQHWKNHGKILSELHDILEET